MEALTALGNAYVNGQGVPQDFTKAADYFKHAADAGFPPALFNLGLLSETGQGMPHDLSAAFKYYMRAAQLGYPPALFNVGNMYATGAGIQRDPFEAALWFRQAADKGVADAQYNLALGYETGRGVPRDEATAQKWYRMAANQGYAKARYNWALMLEEGRGSAPNQEAAAALYKQAALQGFGPAQNNYGIMLAEGRAGGAADLPSAYIWLSLAVENGSKSEARDTVAARLNATELARANIKLAALRGEIAGASSGPGAYTQSAPASANPAPVSAAPSGPDPTIALRAEVARLEAQTAALATAKAQSERRISELTDQLQAARSAVPAPQETQPSVVVNDAGSADSRVRHLEEDNARLSNDARDAIIQLSNLERQLQDANDKLSQSDQNKGTQAPAAAITPAPDVSADLTALRAENAKLSDENHQLSDSAQKATSAASAVQEKTQALANAQSEIQKLEADNSALQQKAADAATRLTALAQSPQLQMDLVTARRDAEELRAKLDASQDSLAARTKALSDQTERSKKAIADVASRRGETHRREQNAYC